MVFGYIDIVFIKFFLNLNKCICMYIINFVIFIIVILFLYFLWNIKKMYIKYDYYED